MKLANVLSEFLSFKRAIGMQYRDEYFLLRSFSRAMGDINIEEVGPASVADFLSGTGPITPFWHRKYRVLNVLYQFALTRGYVDSSPLPRTTPKRPERLKAHIYTTDELRRLLLAVDTLETVKSRLQACTLRTLVLILYGAGLRIGEALSLSIADVNLRECMLTIRNSKFYKTRLVPIGPSLTSCLRSYLAKRRSLPCPLGLDSAFLCTRSGNALTYHRATTLFRRARNLAGIVGRPHDMRHTAAVHRVEAWYREGKDVQRLLPQLATYLGHRDIAGTQTYLTMTPDLLKEASRRFERYALEVTHG